MLDGEHKDQFYQGEDFTGELGRCMMLDRTECTFPTIHAYIDLPFFIGNVVALALSSAVADVILKTSSVSTTLHVNKVM